MKRLHPPLNDCLQKGQLSLEYLLLLFAFFSVLLLMLPLIQRAFALAQFAFDARQAESFSKEFVEKTKQLAVLSDGSALLIEANPLCDWRLSVKEKKLFVSVSSGPLGKTKAIETALFSGFLRFDSEFKERTVFVLEKRDGTLTVYSNP